MFDGAIGWYARLVLVHGPLAGVGLWRVGGGDAFACALTGNEALYCWGSDSHGQQGDGPEASTPIELPALVLPNVRELAVGFRHVCVVTSSREVLCWGDNEHGQLGDGSEQMRHEPTPVRTDAMCP